MDFLAIIHFFLTLPGFSDRAFIVDWSFQNQNSLIKYYTRWKDFIAFM